jgi:antitoxin (DNA-binding transcriptional repressor) of toxin-antitoxin stability system
MAAIDNVPHNVSHYCMPSVNIRQLRDTRRLKAWLRAGKTVELRERDHVIAHIVPEQEKDRPVKWPNFETRRKKVFGDRVLPGADLLIEERGRY